MQLYDGELDREVSHRGPPGQRLHPLEQRRLLLLELLQLRFGERAAQPTLQRHVQPLR